MNSEPHIKSFDVIIHSLSWIKVCQFSKVVSSHKFHRSVRSSSGPQYQISCTIIFSSWCAFALLVRPFHGEEVGWDMHWVCNFSKEEGLNKEVCKRKRLVSVGEERCLVWKQPLRLFPLAASLTSFLGWEEMGFSFVWSMSSMYGQADSSVASHLFKNNKYSW